MAIVTYGTDSGQESRSSQQLHKPMVVATVNWSNRLSKSDETLVHPRYAPTASGYHAYPGPIFYPERNLPETEEDSTLYDFVSVEVNLDPPIPAGLSAELYAQVLDPDNYVFGVYDYNDTQDTIRALDNYRGSSDYSSLSSTVGGELSSLPPIGGGYSNNKTLEVQLPGGTGFERIFFRTSEPQPGNNWQVVVHNEEAIAKTVGYQDGVLAPRRNNQHMPYQIFTPILTAVRSLFIEADEMLSPTGNTPALKRGIFNGEAGCNGCDDPLPSGTTVGSVDMNVLYGLMQPLLIHVRMLPASLNEHPNVPFQHYAGEGQVAAGVALDYRDVESERDYWVIQMVSAYEGTDDFDNDDDKPFASKSWQLGYTTNFNSDGACLIYIEEIRDVVADADNTNPVDLQLNPFFLGIVSAHEAVHRFVGPHRAAIDEEIMDWEKVLLENSEIRFSPLQVKIIQSRQRPKRP